MLEDTALLARIHVLDPAVAERIAAGEVIERPSSVVKELIENSLDAGAKAISVEIRQGGLELIRVADDGSGILREDLPLAFQRFTTSKIASVEDLSRIRTLGFRGEALAAIAAMSHVEVLTRSRGEVEGTHMLIQGDQCFYTPAPSPVGCSVTVTNLFYNAPARRKFLKSPLREAELCRNVVIRYALAFPHVAFRLRVDGRETLAIPAGTLLERIAACLGRDIAKEMVPLEWEAADLKVYGYVCRPTIGRSHRQAQYFFANRRPIRSGLLAVALERPYEGRLPFGRHPIATVFIEMDPAYVDVNVHPSKAEVRFLHERSAYWAVAQAVERALSPFSRAETSGSMAWPFAEHELATSYVDLREMRSGYHIGSPLRAVGQLHNSYILAQSPEGLVVIDPHAAHEAILFERLWRGEESQEVSPPFLLPLTAQEAEILSGHLDMLATLGIQVEPFGKEGFVARALPPSLARVPLADLFTALVEELAAQEHADPDALREALAMRAACAGAIKAGDILSLDQIQKLVDEMVAHWSPAVCPHGRPAFITLSLEELDRRFLRR
ncbi:MAG: DNA mismatch repair endonuclease MutL [Anaerolineae bacterium]|nr:DNA mismatch repair endonuclease MutL [Anaerolineae bacterium]MDW8098236.1 DNA mismatch repair endonuclease MutL [Anaerolineae bacterium]